MQAVVDQSSRLEKIELIFLLSFTCNYVGFLFGGASASFWCLKWSAFFIVALPGPCI